MPMPAFVDVSNLSVSAVSDSQREGLLGRLCWYTVHDKEVSINELKEHYSIVGLPAEFLPKPVRPIDAFRRATTELEATRIPCGNNYFLNILIREVKTDPKVAIRHIVKEIVDSKNVRLQYSVTGEIVFERETNKICTRAFTDDTITKDLLIKAEELYNKYKENYDGSHIRRLVRDILYRLNPVIVRPSGGVYFVPEEHAETLLKLKKLIQLLGSEFFTIPLINDAETRDMILKKYVDQVTEQIIEISTLMNKGDVTKAEMVTLFETSKKLLQQLDQYEGILQAELTDLKERANLLKLQLMQILEQK